MEDYFQGGMSESLWSSSKCDNYDPMTIWGVTSNGIGTLDWTACEIEPGKSRSSDEPTSSPSGSTISSQDIHKFHILDNFAGGSFVETDLEAPVFALSPSSMKWNQTLFGRDETSFHVMRQQDLSSKPMFLQDQQMNNMNQSLQDKRRMSYDGSSSECGSNNFQLTPTSYGYPPVSLPGLFETETELQASSYKSWTVNPQPPMIGHCGVAREEAPQFFEGLPAMEQYTKQWHHSNNMPSWINASAAPASEAKSLLQSLEPTQFATQRLEQKFNCSNPTMKSNTKSSVRDLSSSSMKKANSSDSSEPSPKKSRIDMPSPLPSFKVRKEKLGDRITALQQLVSPFGKTDTASVLYETVEYIKFLHEQVSGLSTTYLKTGYPMQHQQNPDKPKDGDELKQDLRSRGLCLVPVASTYSVTTDSSTDIWALAFGGIYSNRRAETSFPATRQEDPSTRRF